MGEEVNLEEIYSTVAQQNSVEEIKPKKSKKWLWIIVVLVLVVLLVVGLFFINVSVKANKAISLEKSAIYMTYKCLGYCPYSEVYTEWGAGATVDSPAGSGLRKITNDECKNQCYDNNVYPLEDKARDIIEEGMFSSFYKSKRTEILEEKGYEYIYPINIGCLSEVHRGDKSCLESIEENIKLDKNFISPDYENITLNITSISCSREGIDLDVDLIEGEIYGLGFILAESGNTWSTKKFGGFIKGSNKISISSQEYSSFMTNPERVEMFYITAPEDGFTEGRPSEIYSARLCE